MSQLTVSLVRAFFGMGNSNHQHVHRHNQLQLDSLMIDQLRDQQENGGILPSTLNSVAAQTGALTNRPQGWVDVEGGFNVRRGIGSMTFVVESNAEFHYEMAVVGYIYGGQASHVGISEDCIFVPVRCWSTLTTNTHDASGFPKVRRHIDSSHQFLMGDPNQKKDLKSVRPIDIGNEAMGFVVCQQEGTEAMYSGTVGADLRNNVLVSKTQNLNPTNHARELLRLATRAGHEASNGGMLEMALADGLIGTGIGEISVTENPFFQAMMFSTGHHSLAGFQGFSIGEIYATFDNLLDVMDLTMLNPTRFGEDNTMLTSQDFGSASLVETIATELAMMTVHLLLQSGLSSFSFSATNNAAEFMTVDNTHGVVFIPGKAMSLLDGDMFVANRVETFQQLLIEHFFSKYSGPYAHLHQIVNVAVESHMFGETTVTISLGDGQERTYTNATYYINHTSSSISGSEQGLLEAQNFVRDLKDYFRV